MLFLAQTDNEEKAVTLAILIRDVSESIKSDYQNNQT